MKKLIILLSSVFLLSSCNLFSDPVCIPKSKIHERNRIFYQVNEAKPFTGIMCEYYINGQKKVEVNVEDGKANGKFITWYKNGQKKFEKNWRDNRKDGKSTYWNKNGQITEEKNYKDGKLVN